MEFYKDLDFHIGKVIDSLKGSLYKRHENIFDRLDFDNDTIYQEPLLYTYITQTDDKWLDCIIYGYEKVKKEKIYVYTNSLGIVYLPQIGYFKTNYPNERLVLITTIYKQELYLDDAKVDYEFEPNLYIDYGIEVMKHQHPLLEEMLASLAPKGTTILMENLYKEHIDNLYNGLQIIKRHSTDTYELLIKNLRRIMLFNAKKPNSFAGMKAHNMIFLNVNSWDTALFFTDHILHEGGHVNFFTLTFESKYTMFNCHPDTTYADFTGITREHGTIYLRFHALNSYLEITKCLAAFIKNRQNPPIEIEEAKGRFAFHMMNFKVALDIFENIDVLKEEGLKWFKIFKDHYSSLQKEFNEMKDMFQFSEQPYDFNYKIFLEQNPPA